ncbi:hypothetical protein [Streptomyces hesseae]|uniref:Transposase IS4-like domain-containing protein n=1 Tax=Streptomyces hesseae TaxID=3075519 RepID=A0ABU2SH47_9ACTN|nr:hypothetical protein [Streptomyces sp. DSM 40473]MDT0448299.1 hypothetical protein [Streptomyces sp. DSM 40473]
MARGPRPGGRGADRAPGRTTPRGPRPRPVALVVRDKRTIDDTVGIRDWADVLADRGYLGRTEARRFNALLDEAIASGHRLPQRADLSTLGSSR